MSTVTAAAVYVRISRDSAGKGLGVARQEHDCRALAEQLGWPIASGYGYRGPSGVLDGVYEDNDVSATSGKNRPAFERMLADIAAGSIDAVLVLHVDRLYRRMADLERIIDAIGSVPIETVQSSRVDLASASWKQTARILGSVAAGEAERIGERVAAAHKAKVESGEWTFPKRVFGYALGGTDVVAEEAAAIERAAREVLSGVSTGEIARRWTEQGLVRSARQPRWDSKAVVAVLRRPINAARVVYKDRDLGIPGKWPAILDGETFDSMVAFLDGRRQPRRRARVYQGGGVYWCGKCDAAPMDGAMDDGTPYYRCRVHSDNRRDQVKLDEFVDMVMVERLSAPDAQLLLDPATEVDVPNLTAQRDGLQARLDELALLFSDGDIDGSQLKTGSVPLRDKVAEIDRQLALQAQDDPLADFVTGDVAAKWKAASPDRRGKVIGILAHVVVLPIVTRTGRVFDTDRIAIEWKR